jgi:adenosylcobinamide-GDP ribazoletransferase
VSIVREIRAAVAAVAGIPALAADLPREAIVGGLAFLPAAGAVLGAAAAMTGYLVEPLGPLAAAGTAIGVVALVSRGRTLRGLTPPSRVLSAALVAGQVLATALIPPAARLLALPLACMLGRWAVVVECYGGSPAGASGLAAQLVGRARLREFGWASAVAFGTTLATLDAVGLVVLLAATLTAVGVRVVAYRNLGGVDGRILAVSGELVALAVLAVLAGLARR